VDVPTAGDDLGLQLLAAVLRAHPGRLPVEIRFAAEGRALLAGPSFAVDGGGALRAELAAIPFLAGAQEAQRAGGRPGPDAGANAP
jgi:uncharacterized protein YciI